MTGFSLGFISGTGSTNGRGGGGGAPVPVVPSGGGGSVPNAVTTSGVQVTAGGVAVTATPAGGGGIITPPTAITNTILEPSTSTITVGVPVLISGRTNRAASGVAVSFAGASGAATVSSSGLSWSAVLTPTTSGAGTVSATATDAVNSATATDTLSKSAGAAVTFPSGITPAVWFDGRQQAYSDAGGTVPVSAGRIRRINEASPLAGNWVSASDPERPFRESEAVRLYLEDTAGGDQMTHAAVSGIARNSCTLAFSFVARDQAFAGPQVGLFQEDAQHVGILCGSNTVWAYDGNGGLLTTTLVLAPGFDNSIVVRYTATTVDVWLNAAGTVTTQSFTGLTILSTAITSGWHLALNGGSGYLYGSVSQALMAASSLTTTQCTGLLAWMAAQAHSAAYPLDSDLVTWVGDSITRSTATNYPNCFASRTLAAARAAGYSIEGCNCGVGGTGITSLLDPSRPSQNVSLFLRASDFYSALRRRNVMVIALSTNDIANGNSTAYVLYGTAPPSGYTGSGLFPAIDAAIAQGWRVLVITPGPRTDTGKSVSQATYDANRTIVCDALVAGASSHGYTVLDTRPIANYGGPTDSNSATYYSGDHIHPIDAGHALVAPYVAAAVLGLLV